jgi:hypothetical protein
MCGMKSFESHAKRERQMIPPPMDSESSEQISDERPVSEQDAFQKAEEKTGERTQKKTLAKSVSEIVPVSQRYVSEKTGNVREVIFDPALLAKGGEHLVFEFENPKHQDVVYKVNFNQSLPVLSARLRGEFQQKEAVGYLKEQMNVEREKIAELRSYFGFHSVPPQQFMIRDVPVSPNVYQALTGSNEHFGWFPEKIPAWVVVQKKMDLADDQVISLTGHYPEKRLMQEQRSEAHEKLFDKAHVVLTNPEAVQERGITLNEERAMALSMFPQLMSVHLEAQTDAKFLEKLQETVKQMVRYLQETGNALDLAGSKNMVLLKEGDSWNVRFPDPFITSTPRREKSDHPGEYFSQVEELESFANSWRKGFGFHPDQLTYALNTMNTVRVTNALAIIAGIPDRVHIPAIQIMSPKMWREVFTPMFEDRDRNRRTGPPVTD